MQFYAPIRKNETELCTDIEQSLKTYCQMQKVRYRAVWNSAAVV